jgi:hypothetical protein
MTTTEPIATAARAAARNLIAEYGPGLEADVEAALHAEAEQRPGQYLDPVSVGGLIVAIATLAWTIYTDQRKHTREPAPELIERRVRIGIREHTAANPQEISRITEIVVTQISQSPPGRNDETTSP